ncbi:MAG: MarR family transcriptional regulator [Phaeodactylibacter sp.]|nr:MarR family transcriptional regulator [Phaeodactylibacter sp.]MCB9266305.1 MarR family transcriptional regulator [Lewinellaceae bacterium]MCB9290647.1 MarR family transcriptional regulator [Lewinellaceae bacterium]
MPKQDQPAPEAHLEAKVEQLGIAFEKLGMSPINARVMGFLLLAEPPYKDFYEIRDFLGASKSSISLALNHLMNQGIIDYLTFRGDRRRYFRINTDNWLQKLKQQTLETGSMRLLLEEVLEARTASEYPEFGEGLQEIVEFQEFIAQGIELMVRKWEERGV